MGQRLPPEDLKLYRRCDEILHYLWDPIGVSDAPAARDEYHAYLPHLFSLVKSHAPEAALAAYLAEIELDRMGLQPDLHRAAYVAQVLIDTRDELESPAG